jgi:integrase
MTLDELTPAPAPAPAELPVPAVIPACPEVVLPLDQVREFVRASKAENTLRGYQSDWREFCTWSDARGLSALPAAPEKVASYIAGCASHLKPGSIQRRLNAIAEAHKALGLASPTSAGIVRNTLKGIRRTLGTAPAQKAPTLTADIRAMVDAADAGLIGARDRALVLLGFAGAFRRSELAGLEVADLEFTRDGLTVTLRRSKTDQEGAGRKIGVPYGSNPETCPVRTVQAWLETAGIAAGPVFRSLNRHGQVQPAGLAGIDVARVVKKLAELGGPGSGQVRRAFPASGPRYLCGHRGRFGAVDHGPDGPPKRADGPEIHPGRELVPGEFRGEVGAVNLTSGDCSAPLINCDVDCDVTRQEIGAFDSLTVIAHDCAQL